MQVFAARSCGTYLPGTGMLSSGAWCGPRTPCSWDVPPKFLSTTCGCRTSLFCICTPPTSLDVCDFFNSVVVRLPFNSISDGSQWWLVYILVVILMWLCEEVSHVFLHHHLGWKSWFLFKWHRIKVLGVNHQWRFYFFNLLRERGWKDSREAVSSGCCLVFYNGNTEIALFLKCFMSLPYWLIIVRSLKFSQTPQQRK